MWPRSFNRKLEFYTFADVPVGEAESERLFSDPTFIYGKLESVSPSRFIGAQADLGTERSVTHKLTTRYLEADIFTFIRYAGHMYRVHSSRELEDYRYTEFRLRLIDRDAQDLDPVATPTAAEGFA